MGDNIVLRIGLFLLTNLAVMLVAGVVLSLLGVGNYRTAGGLDLQNLLIFCAVFGFVGCTTGAITGATGAGACTCTGVCTGCGRGALGTADAAFASSSSAATPTIAMIVYLRA